MSADSNLHYIVSPITFKLIFTVTEAKNRAVENWGNLILGKCRDLPYPSLSRFRVVSNDCVRSIESVSKEKSKRKKRNKKKKKEKKTGSTRKTTLIVGTHKSSFHVRWLHTRKYESDIDHPV